MWLSLAAPGGVRVARVDGSDERAIAPDFVEALAFAWLSGSDRVLVLGRADVHAEPELWVASLDGDLRPTGFAASVRRQGIFALLPMPIAWAAGAVVFCGVTRQGGGVFRQRLTADGCAPVGDVERVSPVSDTAWFPAAATSGRLAFVNVHQDMNLWSIAIDERTGAAFGPLRRLTRGPGIQNFLCTTADGRFLFHASGRAFRPGDSAPRSRVRRGDQRAYRSGARRRGLSGDLAERPSTRVRAEKPGAAGGAAGLRARSRGQHDAARLRRQRRPAAAVDRRATSHPRDVRHAPDVDSRPRHDDRRAARSRVERRVVARQPACLARWPMARLRRRAARWFADRLRGADRGPRRAAAVLMAARRVFGQPSVLVARRPALVLPDDDPVSDDERGSARPPFHARLAAGRRVDRRSSRSAKSSCPRS